MVQGPNDLDALKAVTQPVNATPVQRNKAVPQAPVGLTQEPDTVQLSTNAVQAAANAKAVFPATIPAAPAPALLPPLPAAPPAGAPATVAAEAVSPVRSMAAAAVSANTTAHAVAQAEPEVRPTQVQAAVANLAALSGNSGALNASVAEKLLTEI